MIEKVVLESNSSASNDDLKNVEGIGNFHHLILELYHFKNVAGRTSLHQRQDQISGLLDRDKISDRDAVFTVASVISATGQNLVEFTINCCSL